MNLTKIAETFNPLAELILEFAFFIFIVGGACWHGYVFYEAWKWKKIELTGIFKETPMPGYVWQDDMTNTTHLFWQNTEVAWKPGIANPNYENVFSDDVEGSWRPRAGYEFINLADGLYVRWKAGIRLRDYKLISSDDEGVWKLLPGYVFIDSPSTTWKSGLKDPVEHPNLVTGETEGDWIKVVDTLSDIENWRKIFEENPSPTVADKKLGF